MDAVKFLKEKGRMCNYYSYCNEDCPVIRKLGRDCSFDFDENYEELVKIVEEWSRKNPGEVGKKYIIEIDRVNVNGDLFKIKGIDYWSTKEELEQLEEYKESEE